MANAELVQRVREGCGKQVEEIQHGVETIFLRRGSEFEFIRGKTVALSSRDKSLLQNRSPIDLVESVILSSNNSQDHPNEYFDRVNSLVSIWEEGNPSRRSELHKTLCLLPPLRVDTRELEHDPQNFEKDSVIRNLLKRIFTKNEHWSILQSILSGGEEYYDSNMFTSVRRIVSALREQSLLDYKNNGVSHDDNGEVCRSNVALLTTLLSSDSTLVPVRTQKEIAEIISFLTPETEALDSHIRWLSLLSGEPLVVERATREWKKILQNDTDDGIRLLSLEITQTATDSDHKNIWYRFAELMSGIGKPVGIELFNKLSEKLRHSLSIDDRDSLKRRIGPISSVMDTVLRSFPDGQMTEDLFGENDPLILLELLLNEYLQLPSTPNTWMDRTWMLNLAEILGENVQTRISGSTVEELIERVGRQNAIDLAPEQFTQRPQSTSAFKPRLSEKEAKSRLSSLLLNKSYQLLTSTNK